MTDWTAGYVADIGYTFGYYAELNPLRVKLAFLNAGLAVPEFGTACELGFGQGMSANLHAAGSMTSWHGTDFNPSQANFAQELATASGAGAKLFDDAFADFAKRPELPEFDYIGIHGIWSWISDENRSVIVEFIRSKLKVGGILYISYNTLPGCSVYKGSDPIDSCSCYRSVRTTPRTGLQPARFTAVTANGQTTFVFCQNQSVKIKGARVI